MVVLLIGDSMDKKLTAHQREIRSEYTGVINCLEGLVEGLPRLVADFATADNDLMLTVLMDVKSEYGWRLSDHYLSFKEQLDIVIRYGKQLEELITKTDDEVNPEGSYRAKLLEQHRDAIAEKRSSESVLVHGNPMTEVLQKMIDPRTPIERMQDDLINKTTETVSFTVDGEEFALIGNRPYTEKQILELAGRTPGHDVLIHIDDKFVNGFREVKTSVWLSDGMEFSARPPTGQATQTTKGE